MDAKYLAEIKARDCTVLPDVAAPVFRDRHALLAEVERLAAKLQESPYGDNKIDELEESCDNLRFHLAAKDQQISTLKRALERAEEHINEIYSYLDYDYCGSCQQVKEAVEDYRYGVQQAQEQEGKK